MPCIIGNFQWHDGIHSLIGYGGAHGISYVHTVHHGIYISGLVMGRASGPGMAVKNRTCDGLRRAAAHPLKFRWSGPGRDPSSQNLMGRAGSRLMTCGLCMGRSARPMRRPTCFDGPTQTAAHAISCTTATITTSTVPMRPPTFSDGPAWAVAHEMWYTTATTSLLVVALYLIERTCCSSVYFISIRCTSTGIGAAAACCCCCCCGRCRSTRRWWSTGSHPTES